MDADGIFFAGERGFHLLFDGAAIEAAFRADPEVLRRVVTARREEVEGALQHVLRHEDPEAAREVIAGLLPELRHVLVLLYFELLEARLRQRGIAPH